MLQPLPTIHYSPRHRFLRGPSPTYPFHTNGLQPYGLFNVTQGAVNLLDDMEEVLFPADYEKITFYFEVRCPPHVALCIAEVERCTS